MAEDARGALSSGARVLFATPTRRCIARALALRKIASNVFSRSPYHPRFGAAHTSPPPPTQSPNARDADNTSLELIVTRLARRVSKPRVSVSVVSCVVQCERRPTATTESCIVPTSASCAAPTWRLSFPKCWSRAGDRCRLVHVIIRFRAADKKTTIVSSSNYYHQRADREDWAGS